MTEADASAADAKVDDLRREGQIAFIRGQRRRAHDLWRQAAMLKPYDEQIWTSIYKVLDNDADRRVCLQNIVAINAHNDWAAEQLQVVNSRLHEGAGKPSLRPVLTQSRPSRWRRFRRFIVLLALTIFLLVCGLAVGIGLSLVLNG
jgi:hypothetical protein